MKIARVAPWNNACARKAIGCGFKGLLPRPFQMPSWQRKAYFPLEIALAERSPAQGAAVVLAGLTGCQIGIGLVFDTALAVKVLSG
jgi:hypothetical protein